LIGSAGRTRTAGSPAPNRRDREAGSASLEVVILTPALIGLTMLVVLAGLIGLARQAVDQVAWEAAREASLARGPDQAVAQASGRAQALLAGQFDCLSGPQVTVDTSGFSVPGDQIGFVRVEVVCQVSLSDIAIPGLPGSVTIRAEASSPIDFYRGR
jgi:hypothetical protein